MCSSDLVEKLMLMMGPGMISGARSTALSFNGTLALNISNIFEDTVIQREYFTTLVKFGVPVKIESNRNEIMKGEI